MKVSELVKALQGVDQNYEVKILGEYEGTDLDINPSVVVLHPSQSYVALLPDRLDVDLDEGEQVILDESDEDEEA